MQGHKILMSYKFNETAGKLCYVIAILRLSQNVKNANIPSSVLLFKYRADLITTVNVRVSNTDFTAAP